MDSTPYCSDGLFKSKAKTLSALSKYPELSIPPLLYFTTSEWRERKDSILQDIHVFFLRFGLGASLAVRSSCLREDSLHSSGAGAFTSLLHIPSNEPALLISAIEEVLSSYGEAQDEDQVLVQLMLEDIAVSGVIMTCVADDGSPYYVVNYDDESGEADTITAGRGHTKTVYIYRGALDTDFDSPLLYSYIVTTSHLESLCDSQYLDIEFCLTKDNVFHVLQVRPICTQHQWIPDADQQVKDNINFITSFLQQCMLPQDDLYGASTFLGVMPDWNPAEMIGIVPRLLASSLYRDLITRRVWSLARERMGYRSLPPAELMVLLAGRPYIDIRLSFNSFLPKDIDPNTGEGLVSAWLERLNNHTYLHDKIEFEIAQTLMDFCFDEHLDSRYPGLLTQSQRIQYKHSLQTLTREALQTHVGSTLGWSLKAIGQLSQIQSTAHLVSSASIRPGINPLSHLTRLGEECRNLGTLPFSILARHAFMAESLLRTAVKRGALTPERLAQFKSSLKTVESKFSDDFLDAYLIPDKKDNFLCTYGHLRPSTYDLTSPRYIDRLDLFDGTFKTATILKSDFPPFKLTNHEMHALTLLLREAGLSEDPEALLHYASEVIPGRELAKFVFSRHVSDMLEWIALWGESIGLTREDLSFLDIRDITEWAYHALLCDPRDHFSELSMKGRELFDLGRSLKLAYLIRSPRDILVAPQHNSAPNFIGRAAVEAPVVSLSANSSCSLNIGGHIVCIENADPGFDWIFTRNIAGLVTMFGGANSHMAIRCAEYGLPAAIGVGGTIFTKVTVAYRCLLDAGAGVLQVL